MKKFLLTMLLVLAMAIPVFAQGVEVYKTKLFQAWVSDSDQGDYNTSPDSWWLSSDAIYGHIQWELKANSGTTKYVMKITNAAGKVVYKKVESQDNLAGRKWYAIAIPSDTLTPGYYKMSMHVSVANTSKVVIWTATKSTGFRIIDPIVEVYKTKLFQAWVSFSDQGDYITSPDSWRSHSDTIYGHVQWELRANSGTTKYVMKITNAAGEVVYKKVESQDNLAGEKWYAITIPSGTLTSGYYRMSMTVSVINTSKVVTWTATKSTGFRIKAQGPAPVVLGSASNFVILSKSGITDVPTSVITGDVGTSPITGAANGLSCVEVTGNVYSVDAAGPAPCSVADPVRLTAAVSDMELAYTDAEGRTSPDYTELGAGDISGKTLTPGLYKWGTGVQINTDIYLNGGPEDVWIFQIAGDITQASATRIHLLGGALAKNIFWQSFGVITIGTTAHFEGVILAYTAITLNTGATINGRLFAQTAVNLDSNVVTQPAL